MTRETKIGLLVGLAFIIVIGILLSDHLTTRGELPQAQLTQVGNNVRTASAVPAGASAPYAPVAVPQNVTPVNVVHTQAEINTRPPTSVVHIGAPVQVDAGPAATASATNDASITTTPNKNDLVGQQLIAAATTSTDSLANNPIFQKVDQGQTAQDAVALAKNYKPYKAASGDTVSRLATKFLGANTTANRQLIIDANPALKADPAKIVIGHTYMIPGKPEAAAKPADAVALDEHTVPVSDLSKKPEVKPDAKADTTKTDKASKSTTTTTYTIKDKDTLWKIANGDATLMKEIQDLNKDVLKGKTTVRPGATLKIPAKTTVAVR